MKRFSIAASVEENNLLNEMRLVSDNSIHKIKRIAIFERRVLERECFSRTIQSINPEVIVTGYVSIDEWSALNLPIDYFTAILFSIGHKLDSDIALRNELRSLVDAAYPTPVIVLGESEDLLEILTAMDNGAVGYIPASVGVDAIVDAALLTTSGGSFLPTASLRALRDAVLRGNTSEPVEPAEILLDGNLTSRQAAVAEAVRRGKPNKVIAYELNVSESTVKIHIRTIMKKLKVNNRTEAAFRLNSMVRSAP